MSIIQRFWGGVRQSNLVRVSDSKCLFKRPGFQLAGVGYPAAKCMVMYDRLYTNYALVNRHRLVGDRDVLNTQQQTKQTYIEVARDGLPYV